MTCGAQLPATSAQPEEHVLQGRYVLRQKLGAGGMGAVYRAGDKRLSTANWAIKEMTDQAITSPLERQHAREAFLREAEMLAGLSHRNLPRVTDHFEQDGRAYLVMEFVPGDSLHDLMQQQLPVPLPRVMDWARQLCDVLEYLHTRQPPIIFRDLKPSNVMLTPDGTIKLIDFGIARLFTPGKTRDTQAFGTVGYSAPEQYGRGQTDARADVYALGVLLHQLLTGFDPALNPFHLPPAAQINPSIPRHISDALVRATMSDPGQRFPNVRSFGQALFAVSAPLPQPVPLPTQPTAQPFVGQPGSQPFGQPNTTNVANIGRVIGVASLGAMVLAVALVFFSLSDSDPDNAGAGFGILLSLPAMLGGLISAILGIVGLSQAQTAQTVNGRRHAAIALFSAIIVFVMVCVIFGLLGSSGSA